MIAVKDLYTWSEYVAPAETEQSDDEYVTEVADSKLPIYKVGESMKLDAFAEDADGNPVENKQIMAKVDQVQIEDDLSLLEGKEPSFLYRIRRWSGESGSGGERGGCKATISLCDRDI